MTPRKVAPLDRFMSRVRLNGTIPANRPDLGRCWEWTGFTHDGYGRFWFEGRNIGAHRWLLELESGPIPEGLEPDHLCLNRACVRPTHLELVTKAENARRSGRLRRGRAVGNAAMQAAKTACPKGHPYDEINTRHTLTGKRACRACSRVATAERYARGKA